MAIQFVVREHCPVCGSNQAGTLHQATYSDPVLKQFIISFYQGRADLNLFANAVYRVAKCDRCSFIYQTSVLNDEGMAALYGDWVDAEVSLQKKQNARAGTLPDQGTRPAHCERGTGKPGYRIRATTDRPRTRTNEITRNILDTVSGSTGRKFRLRNNHGTR